MTQEEKRILEEKTKKLTSITCVVSQAITTAIVWVLIKYGIFNLNNLEVCELFIGASLLNLLWDGFKLYRINKKHPD